MLLNLCGHDFHYECENLCRVFYPNDSVQIVYDRDDPAALTSRMETVDGGFRLCASMDGAREDELVLSFLSTKGCSRACGRQN